MGGDFDLIVINNLTKHAPEIVRGIADQYFNTDRHIAFTLVSSPDPTLEEGKGSGEFGHNSWARERNLSAPMRLQL